MNIKTINNRNLNCTNCKLASKGGIAKYAAIMTQQTGKIKKEKERAPLSPPKGGRLPSFGGVGGGQIVNYKSLKNK